MTSESIESAFVFFLQALDYFVISEYGCRDRDIGGITLKSRSSGIAMLFSAALELGRQSVERQNHAIQMYPIPEHFLEIASVSQTIGAVADISRSWQLISSVDSCLEWALLRFVNIHLGKEVGTLDSAVLAVLSFYPELAVQHDGSESPHSANLRMLTCGIPLGLQTLINSEKAQKFSFRKPDRSFVVLGEVL